MEKKECDKRNSHISSKLRIVCISSNNVRHPVTKIFTTLHYTSPSYPSFHFTTLVDTTSPHLNFTQLHFTTLSSGLTPFKLPAVPFHLTSPHFTSRHFTALLDDLRHTSIPFIITRLQLLF
jgi:hypothetical protein